MPRPHDDERRDLCFWARQEMRHERQLDLLIMLRRLMHEFAASALSSPKTAPHEEAVFSTVPICIAAVADVIMRKIATDIPSRISCHLMGQSVDGEPMSSGYTFRPRAIMDQVSAWTPPFRFATRVRVRVRVKVMVSSRNSLAPPLIPATTLQVQALLVAYPEWNVARTAALDYFHAQTREVQIFCWDGQKGAIVCRNTARFMTECFSERALPSTSANTVTVAG